MPPSGLLDSHRELDLGLDLGKAFLSHSTNGDSSYQYPNAYGIQYNPVVTQLFQPTEHYDFSESLKGVSASADLPSFLGSWAIPSLSTVFDVPVVVSDLGYLGQELDRFYSANDSGKDDDVRLHYVWADGLTGDASLTLHTHQAPVDNWTLLGTLAEVLDNESFVKDMSFSPGEDDVAGRGDNFWSLTGNLNPQGVVVKPAGINWIQAESAAAVGFVVGELFAPEAVSPFLGFGSAILGESTNFTAPPAPQVEPWAYGGPLGTTGTPDQCDAVIAYWNTKGRVRQPGYLNQLPLQNGEHPCAYVRWHVYGQPKTIKQYYLGDKWFFNGYLGQSVTNNVPDSKTVFKGSPLQGNLEYDFDFPILHNAAAPPGNSPPDGSGGGGDL